MNIIEPRVLKGFRDYLPEQMIARQRMIRTIESVFERYGFSPIQTPALEYADILMGKYGADAERLLYKFTDNGGRDVCLRYDLTVPLARLAAQYGNLPMPFKRYQVAPVWRAEKPAKGRYREFFQCDVDVVGSANLLADAECVAVDADVLTALGVKNFIININNRKVLTGLLESLGLDPNDSNVAHAILRTVDKLPSHGEEAVRKLLADENKLDTPKIDHLFQFLGIKGTNEEKLAAAEKLVGGTAAGRDGLIELREVIRLAHGLGVPDGKLGIDFSIARGLDYYTGSVYETFLLDLPGYGSVMSGGRYDTLISTFLGRDVPAVGISVGIDRLFTGMVELGLVQVVQTTTRVLVCPMGADALDGALNAARILRTAGIETEISLDYGKVGKQLKHADARGIPVAVIIGTDEMASGTAAVKALKTGEQEKIPLSDLATRVKQMLEA